MFFIKALHKVKGVSYYDKRNLVCLKIPQKRDKIVISNILKEEKDSFKEFCEKLVPGSAFEYEFCPQKNNCSLVFQSDENARTFLNSVSQKVFDEKTINPKQSSIPREKVMIAYCEAENVFLTLQAGNPELYY